jgi:menaquinol-cytochrome c reductase iron-sulfur subunit
MNVTPSKSVPPPADGDRRNFLVKTTAVVLGGIVSLVPFLIGLAAALDPLRRKSDSGNFVRIAPLDAVPADGVPRRFAVLSDRTDAWTKFPNEPIGSIYLRRTGDQIEALNSICPHAGCFVDFVPAADCYKCPCHNSAFKIDGAIIQPSPSPRAMDSLKVDIREDAAGKMVWVQFENFYTGISEKLPKA